MLRKNQRVTQEQTKYSVCWNVLFKTRK